MNSTATIPEITSSPMPTYGGVTLSKERPIDYALTEDAYAVLALAVYRAPEPAFIARHVEGVGIVVDTNVGQVDLDTPKKTRAAARELAVGAARLNDLADQQQEAQWAEAIARSAHLPECTGHLPADPETCGGPAVTLPVPDCLDVREGQLLETRVIRARDPEYPIDSVSIMSGGNGTLLDQAGAEQFADSLVSFAAQVRRLARQVPQAADQAESRA